MVTNSNYNTDGMVVEFLHEQTEITLATDHTYICKGNTLNNLTIYKIPKK